MNRQFFTTCAFLGAGVLMSGVLHCSSDPVTAGNTSGGEARTLSGRAVIGGSPVVNAVVRLRTQRYLTPLSNYSANELRDRADATTDGAGRFAIDSVDTGHYFLEVNDLQNNAALLPCTLDASAGTRELGTLPLQPYASIRGTIEYPKTAAGAVFVQMYGLERLLTVDSSGTFVVNDLPAGTYTLQLSSTDTNLFKPTSIADVVANPGAATEVKASAAWKFSQKIVLNTSATGAGVMQDVFDFPLLVRLDNATFGPGLAAATFFAQARDSGQDLRFEAADGTPLPYEIEAWDRPTATAAVWVRIDTVRGDDTAQSILMRWGNPNAPAVSNGRAVFDTASGTIGVWHLGDAGAGVRKNSAQTAFAARPAYYTGDEGVPGIIGACDTLDSLDHDTLGIINTETISLSAWIYPTRLEPYARIIARSDTGTIFQNYALNLDSATQLVEGAIATTQGPVNIQSTSTISTDAWAHLFFTYDGAQAVLYVNGVQESAQPMTTPLHAFQEETFLAWNKNYFGYQKFVGKIDEPRIESAPRSAAWVKLSFESQRSESRMVEIR